MWDDLPRLIAPEFTELHMGIWDTYKIYIISGIVVLVVGGCIAMGLYFAKTKGLLCWRRSLSRPKMTPTLEPEPGTPGATGTDKNVTGGQYHNSCWGRQNGIIRSSEYV